MVRPRAVQVSATAAPIARAPGPSEVPDAELVRRAKQGDRWAHEAIFRKHVEYVAALSARLLRSRSEADDVVQETFLDAFEQIERLVESASLRSWLAGIAVHKVHRRFRKRRLLRLLGLYHSSHEAVYEATARQGSSAEVRAELARLDDVLGTLADSDRLAWTLRVVEGYKLEEVAALCRCSMTTVKRRVRRADAAVRAHADLEEVNDV